MKLGKAVARTMIVAALSATGLAAAGSPALAATGCSTYTWSPSCTSGNLRATTDTHRVKVSGDIYGCPLICLTPGHIVLRDVNNGKIVWRGDYWNFTEWTIGGLYSVYRVEASCVCLSTVRLEH